ncbi:D-alanyl-D-alanine dipeptidase [Stella sp.]|uniref:D-alanyl-D-alanine dipeptidase n=1 Tax=Stella sp. TaxID=2912054 RepID=UPI0035AFAE83
MLVPVDAARAGIVVQLAYATPDNLSGAPIYRNPVCLLHAAAAERLHAASEIAAGLGLRLKIFDAYRPPEAQWRLWEACPDPTFVADPRRGSPHSRGVAIDLTLVDGSGRELAMGTGFDAVVDQSHHGRSDVPVEAQRNRLLLLGIMTAAGWDHYRKEWWHYQLFDARRFPLIADGAMGPPLM